MGLKPNSPHAVERGQLTPDWPEGQFKWQKKNEGKTSWRTLADPEDQGSTVSGCAICCCQNETETLKSPTGVSWKAFGLEATPAGQCCWVSHINSVFAEEKREARRKGHHPHCKAKRRLGCVLGGALIHLNPRRTQGNGDIIKHSGAEHTAKVMAPPTTLMTSSVHPRAPKWKWAVLKWPAVRLDFRDVAVKKSQTTSCVEVSLRATKRTWLQRWPEMDVLQQIRSWVQIVLSVSL